MGPQLYDGQHCHLISRLIKHLYSMGPLYDHNFMIGQCDHIIPRLIKRLDYQMGCHPVSRNVTQNSTSHKMCYSGSEDLIDHAFDIIMLPPSIVPTIALMWRSTSFRTATYCELNSSYHRKKNVHGANDAIFPDCKQ